jgi:excisionase family DNA binding protein
MEQERLLLRVSEAAELLGLGRAQVYAMCSRGQLPTVRIGRSVRLPAQGLRRFVEKLARVSGADSGKLSDGAGDPKELGSKATPHHLDDQNPRGHFDCE